MIALLESTECLIFLGSDNEDFGPICGCILRVY